MAKPDDLPAQTRAAIELAAWIQTVTIRCSCTPIEIHLECRGRVECAHCGREITARTR